GLVGLAEAAPLRGVLLDRFGTHWFSTYAIRPSRLFAGAEQRLCIYLAGPGTARPPQVHTTRYHHFRACERPHLFDVLRYQPSFLDPVLDRIPQLGGPVAAAVFTKLLARRPRTLSTYYARGAAGSVLHYHRSPRYWIRAMDFAPCFQSPTRRRSVHHV